MVAGGYDASPPVRDRIRTSCLPPGPACPLPPRLPLGPACSPHPSLGWVLTRAWLRVGPDTSHPACPPSPQPLTLPHPSHWSSLTPASDPPSPQPLTLPHPRALLTPTGKSIQLQCSMHLVARCMARLVRGGGRQVTTGRPPTRSGGLTVPWLGTRAWREDQHEPALAFAQGPWAFLPRPPWVGVGVRVEARVGVRVPALPPPGPKVSVVEVSVV